MPSSMLAAALWAQQLIRIPALEKLSEDALKAAWGDGFRTGALAIIALVVVALVYAVASRSKS